MLTRKQWMRGLGALVWASALGLSSAASAARLEPYDVAVDYRPGLPVASATVSWKADAPRAYGFDIRRRVSGTSEWVRLRYASEPVRSFVDTNLQPLLRYEYQVVAYRRGGPSSGYGSALAATNLDFPYNVPYAHGITPSNYSQAQKNADALAMYNKWRTVYLTANGAGPGGLRVYKPAENGESVSEGIGYGMLISVYMARADNSGKADFDGLLTYYNSKRRPKTVNGVTTPGLMAWRVNADGSVADWFAAPDGDLDVAYSLLVADKKWGSAGAINYKAEALSVIKNLMEWAVYNNNADPTKNSYLMTRFDLGSPTAIEATNSYTMSSYQMVQYFKQFKDASGDARWDEVLKAGYKFLDYFYNNSRSPDGTQIGLTPFTFQTYPDPLIQYQKVPTRGYNYGLDSGRVPWRVGLDYLWYGNANSTRAAFRPESVNLAQDLPKINAQWLKGAILSNPQNLYAQYSLNGLPSTTARYDQRAVISPMAVGAMTHASNQEWLNSMYDWMRIQVPGVTYVYPSGGQSINAGYFADTVLMICMIGVTGNMPNLPDVAPQQ